MPKRNDSYLSPADLESAGQILFGDNWRAALCDYIGCEPSTLYRYMIVSVPVPKPFAVAIAALLALRGKGEALPIVKALRGVPEPVLGYAASQAKREPKPKRRAR